MRSMYDLMRDSSIKDEITRERYPDVLTANFQRFKFDEAPIEHTITKEDIERPDLMISRYYNTAELDDIVFMINQIAYILETETDERGRTVYKHLGRILYIPTRANIERFYGREYV